MKLLAKFNLILLVIFGAGGFLISQLAHSFLIENARGEVLKEEQLMMDSAKSVRDYIDHDISPLLIKSPGHQRRFLAETVPFFGAQTTFNNLRKGNQAYADYTYREAALNPTNPEDRISDWERDVIHWLRDHPNELQHSDDRPTPTGPSLYLAQPIKATQECLVCHGSPSAAPANLVAAYGRANGFGWKKDEIIGAQIISVPLSVPIEMADSAYHRLLFFLILTMLVAILAIDAGVYWFVIRPLRIVSDTADRVSRGEKDVPSVEIKGKDEIANVASSFNRMQVSLAKALKMLDEE
jgi:HAMP domain-containing protein